MFWNTWKHGAEVASADSTILLWNAVGYNATAAVEVLDKGCRTSDAIILTVPYADGTEQYTIMDEAIKRCIKTGKPVFTTNTDTYHNDEVYAYIGSSNYDIGVKCAKALLFSNDDDIISGRTPAPKIPPLVKDSTVHLQVYWDESDMLNEGIKRRLDGLNTTLSKFKVPLEIFLPIGNEDCPCLNKYPENVTLNEGEEFRLTIEDTVYNYAPRYGMDVCTTHDKDISPSCDGSDPPVWCNNAWCYVDPDNCHERIERSSVGEYGWTDFPEVEPYPYSYGTCGSNNRYEEYYLGRRGNTNHLSISDLNKTKNTLTIVLSSSWASKFTPSAFICGEETVDLPGVPQYGQSPFMQGLTAVSAARGAAIGLAKNIPWEATKGNSASVASAEAVNIDLSPVITAHLSRHGQAIVQTLSHYGVTRGTTWDVWHDAEFEADWIMQHPPREYVGGPSAQLPVPEICTEDMGDRKCEQNFQLWECSDEIPCEAKKLCRVTDDKVIYRDINDGTCENGEETYFEPGMCKEVSATKIFPGDTPKKLCVGHSHKFYEDIYNHIIEAEHFVEITSLDSFDNYMNGQLYKASVRNALTYLANTGREITVKCHFGSPSYPQPSPGLWDWNSLIFLNEEPKEILEDITSLFPSRSKVTVWVGTYRLKLSWNHGKIIVVDGNKLITGGSNYYTDHYLREDPVHDVSMRVKGGVAITAHRYSKRLWQTACELYGVLISHVEVAWRKPNGRIRERRFVDQCPPTYADAVDDGILDQYDPNEIRPKTGASVIVAARLGGLGESVDGGSHTSDLAMLSMMETATESIKLSQQDMLPILAADFASVAAFGGFAFAGGVSPKAFDDTWRIIGGVAKAITRKVDVYMMLSAPCAFAAENPKQDQMPGILFECPYDGGQGPGNDYWSDVYKTNSIQGDYWSAIYEDPDNDDNNIPTAADYADFVGGDSPLTEENVRNAFSSLSNNGWPKPRDIDSHDDHIKDGEAYRMLRDSTNANIRGRRELRDSHRRLVYGYGWHLGNVADWIFAYYMINENSRPENDDGRPMSAEEIVDLICDHAHIGHIRLKADEPTYMRGNNPGGEVGNHAKILMVDDSIVYMGSDNAYGSGLAEFGLITDDVLRAGEFNDQYWKPLWEQTLGTSENGLVSGSSSISGRCPWRDALPTRPAPWNNVHNAMCTTFTNGETCRESGCKWINFHVPIPTCSFEPNNIGNLLGNNFCSSQSEYCIGEDDSQENGSYCLFDEVCQSERCSQDYICEDKVAIGGECNNHGDCINGVCNTMNKCEGEQLENGESCISEEYSFPGVTACKSGRCSNSVCEDKLENGESCYWDYNCESDKCTSIPLGGAFLFGSNPTCGWKEEGESCNYHSDCLQDHCNHFYECGKMDNNRSCLWDSDYESEHCVWNRFNIAKCKSKRRDGQFCSFDNNCR